MEHYKHDFLVFIMCVKVKTAFRVKTWYYFKGHGCCLKVKALTWDAGAKLVRELGDEVIVDPIFHWSEHNDWPCVINWDMTHKDTQ